MIGLSFKLVFMCAEWTGSVLDAGQVTDWDRQYLAGVQLTKVMRLYSQAEINMFLQSENQDTAVMGYFPLPAFQAELAIFREVP